MNRDLPPLPPPQVFEETLNSSQSLISTLSVLLEEDENGGIKGG